MKRDAIAAAVLTMLLALPSAQAETVADWNARASVIFAGAGMDPGLSHRALALFHTALYQAGSEASQRDPAMSEASLAVAMAAAGRVVLLQLAPAKQAEIDAAYPATPPDTGAAADAVVSSARAGAARAGATGAGAAVAAGASELAAAGARVAANLLAARSADSAAVAMPNSYRPITTAGVYVPTTLPVGMQWPQRTPWLMASQTALRPAPPPTLAGAVWARDYNEILAIGGANSRRRSAEQTVIARFWEGSMPPLFYSVVRSVAEAPERGLLQNARLYAAVAQAIDDASIAVFEAKYHYLFWRPVTAIRNGDIDGNDATTRDPSWTPLLTTPMHPEYPCAHCAVSGAVAAVLQAELGSAAHPVEATSTTPGLGTRRWSNIGDFSREVAESRIYAGMHYRNSTEAGTALGRQAGELAAAAFHLGQR